MKKFFLFLFVAILLLVAVMLFNTFRFESKQVAVDEITVPALPDTALKHFQHFVWLRHQTRLGAVCWIP
jgi:hypothetical protein